MRLKEDQNTILNTMDTTFFADKNILITGGSGFLGSWLCDIFYETNANVFCLDNLSTGIKKNISHLLGKKNFTFLQASVNDDYNFDDSFDYILHLASRPSPDDYQQHPVDTLVTSCLGTHKILELSRKKNATALLTSTSEVYGNPTILPTPENYFGNVNPIGIRSCYDEGKRVAEAMFLSYHREYDLDTRIVRIFNTYGPRLREDSVYGRAVSRFLFQALNEKDITVHGDGSQTRSFCYIADLIIGIILTLQNDQLNSKPINLGNPEEVTIIDLAKKIKKITRSNSCITFHSRPEDDPERRLPDISRAKQILNWSPHTSLDEGLDKTVQWLRTQTKN